MMPKALKIPLVFVIALAVVVVLLLATARASADGPLPTLTQKLHAELLKLPPWHGVKGDPGQGDVSEDPRVRDARLYAVAAAISSGAQHAMCVGPWQDADGCQRRWRGKLSELMAADAAIGYWETAYASAIPLQQCHLLPGGCDRGRDGIARARGYWQCWQSACPELWTTEPGSDHELRVAAWESSRLLAGFYAYCRTLTASVDPWEAAFTAYAGRGCKAWDVAKRRRTTMIKIWAKLK